MNTTKKGLNNWLYYLDSRNQNMAYLVVFNFNQKKKFTNEWKEIEGKKIFEVKV
ncbi:MAG: hypothetical protein H7A23_07260 [Leptospiraceae bacterium]|nr:hypothetical protein [Leptospiraceae bacterium]MCP5494338.1 hypothetical protein [Leptospiraceae bacterium]